MRVFLLSIFFGCVACVSCYAQDIHFTQYTAAPMLLNPALTASWKDVEFTLQQKQQWQTVDAYSTSGLSFEIKASRFNWEKMDRMTANYKKKLMKGLAFGLYAYSDKAGDASFRTNNIELGIAYHARIDDFHAISGGLLGGIIQSSIAADKLRFNNQYGNNGFDPAIASNESIDGSRVRADLGMGVLWTYGKTNRTISSNDETNIHAGISVMHLNRPDRSFISGDDRLNMRFTVHSAATLKISNTNLALSPSLLFMKQGKQKEMTAGMLLRLDMKESSKITGFKKSSTVVMGCYYRHKDAIAPYFGFEFSSYSFGFSYDINTSNLNSITKGKGGIEIMLRLSNPNAFMYQNKASFD
ncbi:MAG: PorP/SprF family type IX secretion system membrane protein [Bacteroidota bacterium]|nr:PorP/SprF family type IX secretion system membrane protein [Bacteroidota bacterium]